MIGLALTVLGIVFLVKGRVPYGKHQEMRGPLVYLVAFMMIVPGPIFFVRGFMEGFNAGANGGKLDQEKLIREALVLELPIYAGVALISWLIVATNVQPVKKRRRHRDDYDDYDDRDRRSRDYDDRPRYRGRDDDYDDRPKSRERDDDYEARDVERRRRDDDFDDRAR